VAVVAVARIANAKMIFFAAVTVLNICVSPSWVVGEIRQSSPVSQHAGCGNRNPAEKPGFFSVSELRLLRLALRRNSRAMLRVLEGGSVGKNRGWDDSDGKSNDRDELLHDGSPKRRSAPYGHPYLRRIWHCTRTGPRCINHNIVN
jgi:hypothetical protein